MSRKVIEGTFVLAVVGLICVPGWSAPLKKESDKPLSPPTPEQRAKSVNNLKQIGLAMHNYHDANNQFPTNSMGKDGKPALSWRVFILPYLEQEKLYKEFHLDEPWDSDHNIKLVDKMPKVLAPPRGKAGKNQTFYQMFRGKNCLLQDDGVGVSFAKITDGTSNTFMVVEGGKPVVWTKPADLPYDGKTVPKLGGMFDGAFHALMVDGSVKRIRKDADAGVLKLVIERDDGQIIHFEAIEEPDEKK